MAGRQGAEVLYNFLKEPKCPNCVLYTELGTYIFSAYK